MKATIVSVGNELVQGLVLDTNVAYLSAQLNEMGIPVAETVVIGDEMDLLVREFKRLSTLGQIIVVTGGIGPTKDDLTRQAIADAAGLRLVLHEDILEGIRERFRLRGIPMPESNRLQALIPEGARVLHNSRGTAAGFLVKLGTSYVGVMPGVPHEMKAMWCEQLRPALSEIAGGEGVLMTRSLKCFGAAESWIDEKIGDLMAPNLNPLVGLLAKGGVITVKFTARASSAEEAGEIIAKAKADVRKRLGSFVFGEDEDELEHAVARLLEGKGATLALAESCTGGMISAALTSIPGISRFYLAGIVCYSNESKVRELGVAEELIRQHGAVSEEVARAMAEGARKLTGADYALSVTGIAGPSGGTPEKPVGLVHMALASREGTVARKAIIKGDRHFVRELSTKSALNLLRLRLMGEA